MDIPVLQEDLFEHLFSHAACVGFCQYMGYMVHGYTVSKWDDGE